VRALSQPARTQKALSRRALQELGALQASVHAVGGHRNVALRLFVVSRRATTALAQREFWLEFCWLDQQYRAGVRRLAQFCLEHPSRSP
jgi:hypothetical protein